MKKRLTLICAGLLFVNVGLAADNPSSNAVDDGNADNSKRNKELTAGSSDRGLGTAEDQGNSKEDRELTAKIRQGLMKDRSLSEYARNVKIITRDGKVTLRGPVRSEKEKSSIAMKAQELAGSQPVENQLEIAPGGTSDSDAQSLQ